MRKLILILLPFSITFNCFGQNLVPNPSFEEFNSCPDTIQNGLKLINASTGWFNPGGFTPDYFNPCDTNMTYPRYGSPLNYLGFQIARTGSAYAGIIASWIPNNPNIREYIGVKLNEPLINGEKYLLTYYVNLSDSSYYATNSLGAYLSSDSIFSTSSENLPYIPQIENDFNGNELIDFDNWIKIEDTITATNNEKFLIIGNFRNDINSDTTNLNIQPFWYDLSYYFIDDVSLILLESNGLDYLANKKVIMFPNPFNNEISLDIESDFRGLIYDIYGNLIYEFNNKKIIETNTLTKGIYYLWIVQDETVNKYKISKL